MKKHISKILILIALFSYTACGEFDDLNVNPNEPTTVGTQNMLTNAERKISNVIGAYMGTLFIQHFSQITYTEDSRYQAIRADFTLWYSDEYDPDTDPNTDGGTLNNLQYIIDVNTDPDTKDEPFVLSGGSNANQLAAARILRAYFFHYLTDRWGPLPYSDAFKGFDELQPAYDSQQAIYMDLINELKEAVAQINSNENTVTGDFIFNGDMAEWAKFANTIRMVMALRMADVDPTTAQAEFNDAIADGVIDADLMYPYLAENDNENPWYTRYITRTDYAISNTMADWLVATNDPRLASFADPVAGTDTIVAMPYGLETSTYQPSSVSFPNSTYIRGQATPLPIYTMAQVHFSQAEAAARGWGGDAAASYQAAIQASWDQWGVTYDAATFDAFMADPAIAYDAANWQELIGRQKWIGLFAQGYEAWAEWRRLDEPQLTVAEAPLNPSLAIPLRNIYPTSEPDLNATNYQYAIDTWLGGGEETDGARLWWDVN